MSTIDPDSSWEQAYARVPPWEIGRPQPAFARVAAAGALHGAVLDAGCGTGEHAILAAALGARAIGVDISARAIALARSKAAQRGVEVRFEVLDALALSTLGERFDTLIDSGLLHTLDDDSCRRYVDELHAVLNPRGHLWLMCASDLAPAHFGPRRRSEAELHALFSPDWRIESLTAEQYLVTPGLQIRGVEAWLADVVRV